MKYPTDLHSPWSLHFDRDGTEDFAIICDSKMQDIVTSRFFWLPERRDPIPVALASVRMMKAAPELFEALTELLEQTVDMDVKHGIALTEGERLARSKALKAIKKARTA
jgi:hypothetical protein